MVAGMLDNPPSRRRAWLNLLVHELFQTEQSAVEHPRIEADRLGDVPPALALREVSVHAARALAELPSLMRRRVGPVAISGSASGCGWLSTWQRNRT